MSNSVSKLHPQETSSVVSTAIMKVLAPLTELGLNAGLSAKQMQTILRLTAVLSVAASQRLCGSRVNVSGISATTGVPRSEVAQMLKVDTNLFLHSLASQHQSFTSKVLTAWHRYPKYCEFAGKPTDLAIFGSGNTFEALVKKHGGGIPTRAILDELIRIGAVKLLLSGRVRATRCAIAGSSNAPTAVRGGALQAFSAISTIIESIKKPKRCVFLKGRASTFITTNASLQLLEGLPVNEDRSVVDIELVCRRIRRLAALQRSNRSSVSVTIIFQEQEPKKMRAGKVLSKRHNFRRRHGQRASLL